MKEPLFFAGIDIGSNSLKMKIVQYDHETLCVLEDLTWDLPLGDDAFTSGSLSEGRVEELCQKMEGFARLIRDYGVTEYRAVATSSFRHASNRVFIQDQIRRRSGLVVEIIEDPLEKFLTYKSMKDKLSDYECFREEGTVLVELTSGGCDVSLFRNNKMMRNDEVGLGTQHLKEMMKDFFAKTANPMEALEEYLHVRLDYLSKILKKKVLTHYLAVGGEIKTIRDLFFQGASVISAEDFLQFYQELLTRRGTLLEQAMNRQEDWMEILSSLVFFRVFLEITRCEELVIPAISLRDGLIAQWLDDCFPEENHYARFNEDPFSCSFQMAKSFGVNTRHARSVERHSLHLAQILQEDFSLDQEDRMILRHGALLHEIGKSLDLNYYLKASAAMVRGLRIFSLSSDQVERIARLYDILEKRPLSPETPDEETLKDLRLVALLMVADALDAGKMQRLKIIASDLEQRRLTLQLEREGRVLLELQQLQWAAQFFKRIYGLDLTLQLEDSHEKLYQS